jgi:hypothetical protein
MHLVRSGLPISTAVFATSNITIQIHIECSVAHSIPPTSLHKMKDGGRCRISNIGMFKNCSHG